MDIKLQMAELCGAYSLPMEAFQAVPAFLILEREPEIIEKIHKFRLPEITKLICGSDLLLGHSWAEEYRNVAPLYREPTFDAEALLQSYQDAQRFEAEILQFADKIILERFADYLESIRIRLEEKKAECAEIRASVEEAGTEHPEGEEGSAETPAQEHLTVAEDEFAQLISLVEKEKPFYEKIKDCLQRVQEQESEASRADAYALLCRPKISREEQFLQDYVETGVLTEEDERLFRDGGFVARLLIRLDGEDFRSYAMPVLMRLYDEGVIDLVEGPASNFVDSHPELLSQYLQENIPVIQNPTEEEELLLEKALQQWQDQTALEVYWNSLTDRGSWLWLIRRIHEMNPEDNINTRISRMMMGLGDAAGDILADVVLNWESQDIPVSPMEIWTQWMNQNQIPGRKQMLKYVKGFDLNTRKIQRKLNTAERRVRSQSQELFSALYRPLEQLEELAVSLRYTKGEVKAALVYSALADIASELREGLEVMDVRPLADPEDWKHQNALDFDAGIHCMTAGTEKPPRKVSLNSMGFQYYDEEGQLRQYSARVSPVEKNSQKPTEKTDGKTKVFRVSGGNQKRSYVKQISKPSGHCRAPSAEHSRQTNSSKRGQQR